MIACTTARTGGLTGPGRGRGGAVWTAVVVVVVVGVAFTKASGPAKKLASGGGAVAAPCRGIAEIAGDNAAFRKRKCGGLAGLAETDPPTRSAPSRPSSLSLAG